MRERLGAGIFEGGRDGIGLLRQKGFHPFLCMSGGRRQKKIRELCITYISID